MSENVTVFLREAFDRYLAFHDAGTLAPTEGYLSYAFLDELDQYEWHPPSGHLVADRLRELTNILNDWHGLLRSWHAWNSVLASYEEQPRFELQCELLEIEAVAHCCLLNPSAVRDTLTAVATDSLHQVRLGSENGYRDELEGDPVPDKKSRYWNRKQKESRLEDLVSPWPEGLEFTSSLRKIDDESYREKTRDYRIGRTHGIGPRLGYGCTKFVTRDVVPATEFKLHADGRYRDEPIPGKMMARYGIGGTPPLDMEQARADNLNQYRRARESYDRYRILLTVSMSRLPRKKS